jgi:hypothetical protein
MYLCLAYPISIHDAYVYALLPSQGTVLRGPYGLRTSESYIDLQEGVKLILLY